MYWLIICKSFNKCLIFTCAKWMWCYLLRTLLDVCSWEKYVQKLSNTMVIRCVLQMAGSTEISVHACCVCYFSCFCVLIFFFFFGRYKEKCNFFVRLRITSVSLVAMKSVLKEAVCKRYYPLGFLGNIKHDLQILTSESCSLEEILNCWFRLLN